MIRPRFTISILSMRDLPRVMRCVSSVLNHSRDYNLVLTSNGAEDGIPQYFDALAAQHRHIRVVHNPRNLGFQFPNKLVLAQCTTPYFVMLNDDTEVPPGWLTKLEAVFAQHPRAALAGPMGNPCSLHENFGGHVGHQVEYIEGSCCCCKTDVVVKLGLFADGLKGAYMEDCDLSLRVREAGFSIHLAPFQIVHERSQTSRHVPEVADWIKHNSAYMRTRWKDYFKTRRFDGEKDCRATLVYIHVPGNRKFEVDAQNFVKSYVANPPGIDHDTLIVINSLQTPANEVIFSRLPNLSFIQHDNTGWDIGGYIAAAWALQGKTDMLLLCGAQTTFQKPGWMLRFLEAWAKHGPGVYGSNATYQIRPHLNTSGFACAPEMLLRYQGIVNTKRDRYDFEHGPNAFWMQMAGAGYPVKLVLADGREYDWQHWRKPSGVYCRGQQENCLIFFRMNVEFSHMSPAQRNYMSNLSDKLEDQVFLSQLKTQNENNRNIPLSRL